jgi:hypothetical protein
LAINSALPSLINRQTRVPKSGSSSNPAKAIGVDTTCAAMSCRSMYASAASGVHCTEIV